MAEVLSAIGAISQYGSTPALLVLLALVAVLIRKIDQNATADRDRHEQDKLAHDDLYRNLVAVVKESETRTDERIRSLEDTHGDLARRVNLMERDYLPRDEHYKEFSGWRSEINRLSDLIIQLWKEKK